MPLPGMLQKRSLNDLEVNMPSLLDAAEAFSKLGKKSVEIDQAACVRVRHRHASCMACFQVCAHEAIARDDDGLLAIDNHLCTAAVPVQAFAQRVRCNLSKMFPSLFRLRSRVLPNRRTPCKMIRTRAAQMAFTPKGPVARSRSAANICAIKRLHAAPNQQTERKQATRLLFPVLPRLMNLLSSPPPARALSFAIAVPIAPSARMRRAVLSRK